MTSPSTKTGSRRKGVFADCSSHMILPVCTECLSAFSILPSHCRKIIHCGFLHQLALACVKFAYGKKCLISLGSGSYYPKLAFSCVVSKGDVDHISM